MKKFIVIILMLFLWGCTDIPDPVGGEIVTPESIQVVNTTGVTELEVGKEDAVLLAIVSPSNASNDIEWTTSDVNIATVDGGIVTAVGAGEVTITAKSKLDATILESITFTVIDNTGIINKLEATALEVKEALPDETSEKLNLTFFKDGVQIRYASSNEDIISIAGTVSPGRGDKVVKLTIKTSMDGFDYEISKDIIVKGYQLKDRDNRKLTFTYLYTLGFTGFNVGDLDRIDVINLSFAGITNGKLNINEVKNNRSGEIVAAAHAKGVRVVLAVGGWGVNGFSEAIDTPTTRAAFIKSIMDVIRVEKFDGIDLDWEYPTKRYNSSTGGLEYSGFPNDKQNYTKFIQELRIEMDKFDDDLLLTMAVPASAGAVTSYYEIEKINYSVDYLHIMSYDMIGYSLGEKTNHHTNIYANSNNSDHGADTSVKAYINAGLDKRKIVLGVAFYGHAFYNVNPGIANGYNTDSSLLSTNKGTISYNDLQTKFLNDSKYTVYFDEVSKATWLYGNNTFISFDDERSIQAKAEYVIDNGYGGLMTWQYNQDADDSTLLIAMYNNLNSK